MNPALDQAEAALQFLRTGLRNFDRNAAFFAAGRALCEAMVRPLALERARCVVELGPGTGTVTRAILARLPSKAHLHLVELDGELLDRTVKDCADPRLRPLHGDAAGIGSLPCRGEVDAVVSSLGLSLMTADERTAILRAVVEVLAPGATVTQYSYLHARWLVYSAGRKRWEAWYARSFLEAFFGEVTSELVLPNLPPSVAYTCRVPRAQGRTST
jgi:phospholipid N-methyltransferase